MPSRLHALSLACLLFGTPAFAQQDRQRETDIKAMLARISDPDPVERILAAEAALKSEDPIVRSLALEAALRSPDGRVRMQGFLYLIGVQRKFIITIEVPPDELEKFGSRNQKLISSFASVVVTVIKVDPKNFTFTAETPRGQVPGSVNQDGMTLAIPLYDDVPGRLQFRGVAGGLLRGALTCGNVSFAATTPLP